MEFCCICTGFDGNGNGNGNGNAIGNANRNGNGKRDYLTYLETVWSLHLRGRAHLLHAKQDIGSSQLFPYNTTGQVLD